jgi:histidinol-phosphatase (PHP family)
VNEESQTVPWPDYHTHNLLCKHAVGRPYEYGASAAEKGMPQVACTDHCPTDVRFGIGHRMELGQFPTYREWVEEAQRRSEPEVLFGIEADYYPGCEEFLRRFEDEQPLDIVLGSVHFIDYWAGQDLTKGEPVEIWRVYFERVGALARTGLYDVASHLDLPKKFGNPISDSQFREFALPALDALAAAGMALEINTSGLNHPCKELYPSLPLLTWARERGIALTLGSDAHKPERVGADFDQAIAHAKAAGYTHLRRFRQRRKREVPITSGTGSATESAAARPAR